MHQHSYLFAFVGTLLMGSFYLGATDFVTYVVRLALPRK